MEREHHRDRWWRALAALSRRRDEAEGRSGRARGSRLLRSGSIDVGPEIVGKEQRRSGTDHNWSLRLGVSIGFVSFEELRILR